MIQEMFLAILVTKSGTWMTWYLNWREFGHQSLFGETCLSDMSDIQSRLLSMTHLYDVIQSDFSIEKEVPGNLKPYPHQLSKWYDEAKKAVKEKREAEKRESSAGSQRSKQSSSRNSQGGTSSKPRVFYNEGDGAAFAAMRRGQREAGKS